jgi:hypothetical protein
MPTFRSVGVGPRATPLLAFASTDLSRFHFPARGLPGSLLLHGIALFLMLYSPVTPVSREAFPPRQRAAVEVRPEEETRSVMWLPPVGAPRRRAAEVAESAPGESAEALPSPTRGLAYPGPQEIVSDPPDPTNPIQTLLQPELEDLPVLRPLLALPNIVVTAPPVAPPQPETPAAEVRVAPESETPPAREAPRLTDLDPLLPLPPRMPTFETRLAETFAPTRRPEPEPEPPPDLAQTRIEPLPPRLDWDPFSPPEAIPPDPVVVLTPVVEPTDQPVELESPELAGREPRPGLPEPPIETPDAVEVEDLETAHLSDEGAGAGEGGATAHPEEGSSGETTAGGSAAETGVAAETGDTGETGVMADLRSLVALTPLPALPDRPIEVPFGEARGRFFISPEPSLDLSETEPGSAMGEASSEVLLPDPVSDFEVEETADVEHGPVVTISFGRTRPSTEPGAGGSEVGDGPSGTEGASDSRSGSDPGAGAGSGRQPFAGITIVGGAGATGITDSPSLVPQTPVPVKTSYGVFVISTESSGGGLPSFGVFADEQVYTVFLDMRETLTDTAPSWTLQFAGLHGSAVHADPEEDQEEGIQQGLVLPFPVIKKRPFPPEELARPYWGELIVVFAVVNPEGKFEQLEVKDSPDLRLNEYILEALSEWVFRPAVLDGNPVAVKVLMGIPLWLPD